MSYKAVCMSQSGVEGWRLALQRGGEKDEGMAEHKEHRGEQPWQDEDQH